MLRALVLLVALLLPAAAGATEADLYCLTGTSATGVPAFAPASSTHPCPVSASVTAPTTPAAGAASAIGTGGTAVTLVTGPVNGCVIQNPITATDQNITTAEPAYINGVTTATANGRGTNTTLNPGDVWRCVPGQTTNVSIIAATASHAFSVVKW